MTKSFAKRCVLALLAMGSLHPTLGRAQESLSFRLVTTQGDIEFECPADWAPLGAQRLQELLAERFFTDLAVFRMITGFVAQFGISGDPVIAARWENAVIKDDPVVGSNVAGTLSYATAGPDTRTTQLYINLVDNVRLDARGFSPVCRTDARGLEVARKFYAGYGEAPDQDRITKEGNAYLRSEFPKLDYILTVI